MRLDTWIKSTGPRVVARAMNVDPSSVSAWQNGYMCPRPKRLVQIHKLSKGKVSYAEMILHFVKG